MKNRKNKRKDIYKQMFLLYNVICKEVYNMKNNVVPTLTDSQKNYIYAEEVVYTKIAIKLCI